MKTPPLKTIKSLTNYLTAKDKQIADKLIEAKDYDSLKELVDSAIIRAEKSINSDSPKQEYLDLDMEKLEELQAAVYEYLDLFKVDDDIYCFGDNPFSEPDDMDLFDAIGI